MDETHIGMAHTTVLFGGASPQWTFLFALWAGFGTALVCAWAGLGAASARLLALTTEGT